MSIVVNPSRALRRLLLTARDEQSGIKSIACTIYDATLRHNIWTTTQGPQRLPRAQTDDVRPENPERPGVAEGPEGPARVERVCCQNSLTFDNNMMRPMYSTCLPLEPCSVVFIIKGSKEVHT